MFEVNEYMFFEKNDDLIRKDWGYSPSKLIREQILNAYEKGHDVQLHIHPQWLDAEYNNGKIIMKDPKRSITEYSKKEISSIISQGKKKLEDLISDPEYECVALRLTNLPWIEAPEKTWKPMDYNDINIHSLATADSPKNKRGYWRLGKSNVYEIPIHSMRIKRYQAFTLTRLFALLYDKLHSFPNPKSKKKEYKTDKKPTKGYEEKWDFCKLSCKEMIKLLEHGMERYEHKDKEIPLVMIGHSKDFFNKKSLNKFLKIVKMNYRDVNFTTFQKVTEVLS